MKAQELRINNWVKHPKGHYLQVREILQPALSVKGTGGVRDELIYSDVSPIPLTPEILEKCGFEWSIYHQAFHKIGFVFDLSERHVRGYYLHISRNNSIIICPEILHLHQLQNLIYALTGEELEFKP